MGHIARCEKHDRERKPRRDRPTEYYCPSCRVEHTREWRRANPEQLREQKRRRRQRIRERLERVDELEREVAQLREAKR